MMDIHDCLHVLRNPYGKTEQEKTEARLFAADQIDSLSRALNAAEQAAEMSAKWMQWWLDQNECDCGAEHVCGRPQRQQELRDIRQALSEVRKIRGSDGS